ncbi:hypothetical protein EDC65_5224 [Stella humosa]|uniref:Uncharacterized protein n=1 Tax=Stella humosa TaxID=94 RepID=A0A3N1KTE0_9PROT|nr:hypothetical protein EDC65_5224 [Stella humosa]BBK32717.1 hypothetical protein STHU_33510 [Stella humosa]
MSEINAGRVACGTHVLVRPQPIKVFGFPGERAHVERVRLRSQSKRSGSSAVTMSQ